MKEIKRSSFSIKKPFSFFCNWDAISCLRYDFYYLEAMRSLPQQHSELYDKFMIDRFVVRQDQGVFNAGIPWHEAAANHPLVTDACWDITSKTWQVSQESKWQMVYHEILALSNWLREFTNLNLSNREPDLHHELHGKYAKLFNGNLMEVKYFFEISW